MMISKPRRVVLTSFFGSTGDVAYLAGLGQGFQKAGYSVRMLLPKLFLQETKPILDSMGLYDTECVAASAPTLDELLHLNLSAGLKEGLRVRREFKQRYRRFRSEIAATSIELVRNRGFQFIVGDVSSRHLIVPAYAAGIPYFQASPMPYIPTRQFYLDSRFPCVDKLGVWNSFRWTWGGTPWQWASHLTELINESIVDKRPSISMGLAGDDSLAKEYDSLFPKELRRSFGTLYRYKTNHMISASPVVVKRPSDWGSNVQILGYTPWDVSQMPIPAGLEDFLSAGKPPVYVGFGTYGFSRFGGKDAIQFFEELVAAARAVGERLIFCSAGTRVSNEHNSRDVFVVDRVFHGWLFPRCSVVVCHGGYGTIHSALMARRPLIIYPYQTDQFFLAKRMEQLSVALPYRVTLRRFSARDFRRDLVQISADYPEMQKLVDQVREKIRREDGITTHISRTESLLDSGG